MAQTRPFYTDDLGTPLRIAQVVGLTSTAFLAGKTFVTSFATVPALLESPAPLLARQWKKIFDADKVLAPAIAAFSTGIFGYISYRDNAWTRTSILYATSASLTALLVPYTFLMGEPINQKLEGRARDQSGNSSTDAAGSARGSQEESTHALVDQWATVNFGRFLISALSAVLATWAAVDRAEIVPAVTKIATGADRMGR